MATKKKPWSADLPLPPWAGGPEHEPVPAPDTVTVGHSISPLPAEQWECLRCAQLDSDETPTVPDHALRCPYRRHVLPDPDGER